MNFKWHSNGSIHVRRDSSISTVDAVGRSNMGSPPTGRQTLTNGVHKKDEEETVHWRKYQPALKVLLPYRFSKSSGNVIPSSNSGLISFVTVSWLTSLMWKALRKGLTPEDLWELSDADKVERNSKRLNRLWEEEKINNPDSPSFFKTVWRFGKTRFIACICLIIVTVIVQFLVPAWILKGILSFNENLDQPLHVGVILALLILVTQTIRNLTFCALWMIGIHTGIRVEGAMQYMTYEKLLRLRSSGDNVLAKAITFCTNDQERIFECIAGGVLALGAPVMFIMSIIYTATVLGPWALLGNAVIFLFYPIMGGVAAKVAIIRRKTVKRTNERVGLMTEILNSIRLIKMYGWEESFAEKLEASREREEQQLRKAAFLQSMTVTMTPMINIVASVAVFLGYSLSGNDLTAAKAWSIYSVFAAMQFTVGTLPFAIRSIAEAGVCFRNFQAYLDLPEYQNVTTENLSCDYDSVVVIRDGDFAWDSGLTETATDPKSSGKPSKPSPKSEMLENEKEPNETDVLEAERDEQKLCLANVNLEIKRGKLVGVSGLTGSGKSSLLSAILGDTKKLKGEILIRGSIAIVSQQAWIYSDTFQDNVLFGSPMNKEKYEKVLELCCLKDDLALLPNGDQTIIGDRGVNLSGGQKQRLNLARAIYSDRSIYLLDDPLSAVDALVGKRIFQNCIREYLRDKTVLLVTHGLEYLEHCDEIIFIKDGVIMERGSHNELMALKQDYYYLRQFSHTNERVSDENLDMSPKKKLSDAGTDDQVPTVAIANPNSDELIIRSLGYNPYILAIKAGGGFFVIMLVFFLLFMFAAIRLFTSIWIRIWIDAGDGLMEERKENITALNLTLPTNDHELKGSITDNPDISTFQLILLGSVIVAYAIGALKGLGSTRFVLRGASRLHNQMFCRVMACPIAFFDSSPVGRIVNRFSKDMDELDARMPFFFEFVIQALIEIGTGILVVCIILPWLSLVMILLFGLMLFVATWLTIGMRQTKQLDNVLKSPVIGHLQSSMGGLSIIRTFNRQTVFQKRFCEHINKHLAAEAVSRIASRWFTVRMDLIGLAAIFSTVMFGVLKRDEVSSATVGLTFATVYSVCSFMPFVMRMLSELNARFTSVERILEYGLTLETESEPEEPYQLEESWPAKGDISINSISLRYRPELPLALSDISIEIKAGEKVGVVGRTGAGKTSIMLSVLRLCDYEKGNITIDGVDIAQVQRRKLRQRIAVIPQDPVLFHGSVRYNLDPFNKHSDEELWEALEKSNLKPKISKLKKGLESQVDTEGENFSVGEKQLICLTRAILRRSKILFLDEATASVDVETDAFIQNSIRSAFASCTVVTIAHRLNTIASYDKVLVMDAGKVQEYDSPKNLMEDKATLFYKMMRAAGITALNSLPLTNENEGSNDSGN